MPKRLPAVAAIGRVQAERPPAPQETARQADGPRTLVGALLVPIEQIVPDPDQPRHDMGGDRLVELAASLKEYGVLQPLLVREAGLLDDGRTRYMIVAGGRRYAAAQQAGLARLPLLVRESEGAALRVMQLIENVQRQDLAPLEEARAFQELMDAEGLNAEKLGARLHKSGQHIRTRLLLLSDQVVADAVERAQITPTVAREALRLPDEGRMEIRQRIESGEAVGLVDVQQARDSAKAAGIVNPRAKGGGRAAHKGGDTNTPIDTDTPSLTGVSRREERAKYQPTVDNAPPTGAVTVSSKTRVQDLYSPFQDWRARVYGEVERLTHDERKTLSRLLRADMAQLLQRIDTSGIET
jgi:ParB family chromosome partitioning protein